MIEFVLIDCPCCGERFETQVDLSAGAQCYIEDCAVCCKPIEISVRIDDDGGLGEIVTRGEHD